MEHGTTVPPAPRAGPRVRPCTEIALSSGGVSALRASQDLREALSARNVRFAHWKSNGHLAEALAGETDLDLLVHRGDEAAFRNALQDLRALPMTSPPWARYPEIEDWLILDAAAGALLHLHVHFEMLTGLKRVKHLRLPWKVELLASVRPDPASGWPIPSAEMELLNLLVRIWAKMPLARRLLKWKIPGHIQNELHWLQAQTDPARLAALARQLGFAGDFQDAFDSGAAAIRLGRRFNTDLFRHFRMSWPEALARAALLNTRLALTRLWLKTVGPVQVRKALPMGGAMISLVGSDGSGKSTLGRDLEKWLRYKLDAHLLYMGSGDGAAGWVNAGKRRLSALWKRRGPKTASAAKSLRPASGIERLYRLLDLLLLRRKLRLVRLGRKLAGRGSVILTDRYPQMQVNGISDGPRQQEGRGFAWAARSEMKLHRAAATLGPDLVIKLKIDPQTAQLRKPDHGIDIITRKCAIVDALTFSQSEVVVIDAARPYDGVLLAAKSAIWNHLLKGASA